MVAVLPRFVDNLPLGAVLPSQFLPSLPAFSPVQKLAVAILAEAYQDVLAGLVSPNPSSKRRLGEEAMSWILSADNGYVFCCENCCRLLGSSARDLRRIITEQVAEIDGLRGKKRIAVHRVGFWRAALGEAG